MVDRRNLVSEADRPRSVVLTVCGKLRSGSPIFDVLFHCTFEDTPGLPYVPPQHQEQNTVLQNTGLLFERCTGPCVRIGIALIVGLLVLEPARVINIK